MARLTPREIVALGASTLLGTAGVVTAATGQTRAALALMSVLLVAIVVLVIRNNRAIVRNRRALDWLARPAPTSTAAPSLPEPLEQMVAEVDSTLKSLQRDLESIRFGQTVLTQTTGTAARDLAALAARYDDLEAMIVALRDATVSCAPVSRDVDAQG
ncbi:MAG: hypothetical protein M0Z51_14830 [Propionibacterium sp.]|nr:hypothetical protein [Propionibacterium sp.]